MIKQAMVFATGSLGLLILFGNAGLEPDICAQSAPAVVEEAAQETPKEPCLESTCRSVPDREKITVFGSKHVRGLVGGFEQGAGFAGGAQFTTIDAIPGVTLRANALVSGKLGRRLDFEAFFPNVGGERNHADVWFSYVRRDTNFFGIGPRISRDFQTNFSTEQRSYQASIYRDLTDHFQSGVYAQVANTHSGRGKTESDPPIDAAFSTSPGSPPLEWAPGLFSNTTILSYGSFLAYDSRDNSAGLTQGLLLFGRIASSDGLNNHAVFADYGWNEGEFDARGYIPIRSPNTSLALRSRAQLRSPKGGSQIPFYDLSWLGGRDSVRGYLTYRLRANNLLMFSTELRQTVHSTSASRGIDVFAFADSGQVWGDARSLNDPSIQGDQGFSSSNWHSGVGGGLQYRRSGSFAARIEAGRSNEGVLVYVSMSRGF